MSRPKSKAEFVKRMRVVYDSFDEEGKNLSWDEFRNQCLELMDPKKIMNDLGDLQLQRARESSHKIRIDKALARTR